MLVQLVWLLSVLLPSQHKLSLKPRSKTRPRSRACAPSCDRSLSRLSPERDDFHRRKPVGSLPSSYFTGFTSHDVHPQPMYDSDPMPTDVSDPSWKHDLLEWTLRDMRKSWRAGERAWVNLHIASSLPLHSSLKVPDRASSSFRGMLHSWRCCCARAILLLDMPESDVRRQCKIVVAHDVCLHLPLASDSLFRTPI